MDHRKKKEGRPGRRDTSWLASVIGEGAIVGNVATVVRTANIRRSASLWSSIFKSFE